MELVTRNFENAADIIREMRIAIECGNLLVEEAPGMDRVCVEARYDADNRFDCRVDGGIFWLECRVRKNFMTRCRTEICIKVPAGLQLENLDAEVGLGQAQFQLEHCRSDRIRLDVGAGNCRFSGIQRVGLFSAKVGTGEIKMNGIHAETMCADCGVGSFSMKGTVDGDLTVNCGLGSCKIELAGNESDYHYKLSCGLGSVKINGATARKWISSSRTGIHKQPKGLISLENGLGSIDVSIA